MKTLFHSAIAAAALFLAPGALFAVDQFTVQGVKSDKDVQQELNGPGLGPLERNSQGMLIHGSAGYLHQKLGEHLVPNGALVQPNGAILGDDGSERLLENTDRFSIQSGVKPGSDSMPPSGTLSTGKTFGVDSKINEPPAEQADVTAEFQD